MASDEVVMKRTHWAHERALAIIEEHGPEERREMLKEMTFVAIPGANKPLEMQAMQAELISALAELVAGLLKEKAGQKASSKKKA